MTEVLPFAFGFAMGAWFTCFASRIGWDARGMGRVAEAYAAPGWAALAFMWLIVIGGLFI